MRYDESGTLDLDLSELRECQEALERTSQTSRNAAEGVIRRAITRETVLAVYPCADGPHLSWAAVETAGCIFKLPVPARAGTAAGMDPRQRAVAIALFDLSGVATVVEQSRRLDQYFAALTTAIGLLRRTLGREFTMALEPHGRPSKQMLENQGTKQTIRWWADKSGISENIIRSRLAKGWSPDRIFRTKVGAGHAQAGRQGKTKTPWTVLVPNRLKAAHAA